MIKPRKPLNDHSRVPAAVQPCGMRAVASHSVRAGFRAPPRICVPWDTLWAAVGNLE